MKKIVLTLSSLVLSVTVFAFAANASSKTRITVEVPFAFNLGETAIAAGEYSVEVSRDSAGGAAVSLIDQKGKRVAVAIGRIAATTGSAPIDLVFRKNGDERTLSRINLRDHAINIYGASKSN